MDAGAIRIQNTGGTPITINSISVFLPNFSGQALYDPNIGAGVWSAVLPFVLAPGQDAIFTQTFSFNFDTSDAPFLSPGAFTDAGHPLGGCTNPTAVAAFFGFDLCAAMAPTVTVTIDGVTTTLTDSGHVLDTFGYDLAALGNESIGWHDIGSPVTGRENVPEPSSLLLLGTGLLGLGSRAWKRLIG